MPSNTSNKSKNTISLQSKQTLPKNQKSTKNATSFENPDEKNHQKTNENQVKKLNKKLIIPNKTNISNQVVPIIPIIPIIPIVSAMSKTAPILHLQVISDIHLEFRDRRQKYDFLRPSAPILVLAGDVCPLGTIEDFTKYVKFIEFFYPKYEHIIHVPGNHEYYTYTGKTAKNQMTMQQIDGKIKEFAKAYPNLHYLNNSIFRLNHFGKLYYFIGTTMWSKISKDRLSYIQDQMNDYVCIMVDDPNLDPPKRNLTAVDVQNMHKKAIGFIKRAILRASQDGASAIVITHHKPYDSGVKSDLSDAYETDVKNLIQTPVKAWIYGHTHTHDDVKIGGARVVNNGKGYLHEHGSGYIPGFTINL